MNVFEWKVAAGTRLRSWARGGEQFAPGFVYGGLAAATVFPLVEAASQAIGRGDYGALMALGGIASGIGGNLLAEQISRWKDRSEAELAAELGEKAANDADWREALDRLLVEFQAAQVVQGVLSEADHERFVAALRVELAEMGSGLTIDNSGVLVLGARGIGVGGNVSESVLVTGDNASVQTIRTVYMQAPGEPALDEEGFDQALGRYVAWVSRRFGQLNLRGIERRERQVLSLTLQDVYVSLVATVTPDRKEMKRRGRGAEMPIEVRVEQVEMSRLLGLGERLMIVGGPGSGKTTFVQIIASALADALRSGDTEAVARHLGLQEPLPLPILVSLSEYNRYRQQLGGSGRARAGTLIAFISHWLIRQEAAIGLPADFFERLLMQGRSVILLLDGLDEVANERERALVRQAVENVASNSGVRQIVVTCRTRAYRGDAVLPEEFRVAEVQPMDPEQVDALAARWCMAAYGELDAAEETPRLQEAIRHMEALREARNEMRLIESPLLVTIVAIVHYNQRRLPDERAELYERCVDVLLAERHHPVSETTFALADWGGSVAEKRNLLADLAFQMMSAGEEAGRSVDEEQLKAWLRPQLVRRHGDAEADAMLTTFITAMRERGSLLEERGGSYQFIHLSFQEYLCAYHLAETVRELDKIVAFLHGAGRIAESWWRETVLLVVGYLGLRSQENALRLLRRLADCAGADDVALGACEVAATAFGELESHDAEVQALLSGRLVAYLQQPDVGDVRLRAAAGRALGSVGDPRPGVGVKDGVPQIDWVEVAAGPFVMGSDKEKDPDAYSDEQPQFTCALIQKPYRISRYAVTVAQYGAFVAAGGYETKRFWTTAGWRWRQAKNILGPETYDGDFQTPNHPQVGISWYEAVAFCRWLSEELAQEVRLPTEAEWERAARGPSTLRQPLDKLRMAAQGSAGSPSTGSPSTGSGTARIYPWGDKFDASRCNMVETGIGATSAVGIFPSGNAECGAADMAGNVFEWCSTKWRDDYEGYEQRVDNGVEGDDGRVLRGGSWSDGRDGVRCAYRDDGDPRYRLEWVGVRLLSPGLWRAGG